VRDDMDKVLTERPRRGHGNRHHEWRRRNKGRPREKRYFKGVLDDCSPKRESMKVRYGYDRKDFSDLLGPLYSYLGKQCGRPWSKVWSDVCSSMKGNGVSQRHIKGHLCRMVEGISHPGQPTYMGHCPGEPDFATWFGGPIRYVDGRFYVNHAGILLRVRKRKAKR
jgi:hypothetical protein